MYRIFFTALVLTTLFGQADNSSKNGDTLRYIFEPDSLSLQVGETATVTIKLIDAEGNLANNPFLVYGQPRRSLKTFPRISDSTGFVKVSVQPFKSGDLKLRTRSIAVKKNRPYLWVIKSPGSRTKLKKIVFNNLNGLALYKYIS